MIKEIVFGDKIKGVDYLKRPGVYAIAFNEHGEVATIRTSKGYFLPGGGLEGDENHRECIVREFFEETGYLIQIGEYIGEARQYHYSETMNRHVNSVGYFYKVILKDRSINTIEDDHQLLWLEPQKCAELLFHRHQAWAVLKVTSA